MSKAERNFAGIQTREPCRPSRAPRHLLPEEQCDVSDAGLRDVRVGTSLNET